MSRNDPKVMVRLPANLKERLRKVAEAQRRSMNAEIVYLLERALCAKKDAPTGEEFGDHTPADAESTQGTIGGHSNVEL